ncbi:hypothetical protein H8S90_02025 [Olivibacter sp. SDN3]|uniref:ABC transporter substrate-binding protein n=1 Tax=Olivibacter sp. SDN3 TaxID=2764720 RepID=UPI001651A480|nr:hypothetical protein [Olivibacter sp. SDN3]QNL50424.1 hypothetical protein H8S90_02025 [Olivibacter sp. SDN3]
MAKEFIMQQAINNKTLVSVVKALELDEACVQLLEKYDLGIDSIKTLSGVYDFILKVGDILNVTERASSLKESFEERINIVVHKLKFIDEDQRPRVGIIDNISSADVVQDAYLDSLVRTAGGKVPMEGGVDLEPELLLVISKEKPIHELLFDLPSLLEQPMWKETAAVKNNKVFLLDGSKGLTKDVSKVADDVELLAEIMYPNYFIFGGDGESWMKFEL